MVWKEHRLKKKSLGLKSIYLLIINHNRDNKNEINQLKKKLLK
jgi:hypothetical protein